MPQEKEENHEGIIVFDVEDGPGPGTQYYRFVMLLQEMGFTENRVPLAENLENQEFMVEIEQEGRCRLVSFSTIYGYTTFGFKPTGEYFG